MRIKGRIKSKPEQIVTNIQEKPFISSVCTPIPFHFSHYLAPTRPREFSINY